MKKAFSLVEMLVVVGIIAVLVGLTIPAINALQKSYDSTGADSMISAALSTARTLAISNHQYAGVRFQKAYSSDASNADQYMIFIVYGGHDVTNWDCGFIAVEGYKPIKLPSNIGVIDKIRRRVRPLTAMDCGSGYHEDPLALADLSDNVNITDTSTFSIVFSPAGKLVIYEVRCRNNNQAAGNNSKDDVFNTQSNVVSAKIGMFIEDNYDTLGLGVENSRKAFVIYDREKFKTMTTATQRWTYLSGLKPMYVNPYTGQIIK